MGDQNDTRRDLPPILEDQIARERQEIRAADFRRRAAEVERIFTYHAPKPEQVGRYNTLRSAAREFAHVILACTPPCADQSAALRKVREAVMTANAAIALEDDTHTDGRA